MEYIYYPILIIHLEMIYFGIVSPSDKYQRTRPSIVFFGSIPLIEYALHTLSLLHFITHKPMTRKYFVCTHFTILVLMDSTF